MTTPRGTSHAHAAPSATSASQAPGCPPAGFRASLKGRPRPELLCDYVFRPVAHPVVLALARLRVPPPAVVLTHCAIGLVAATLVWRGDLVVAALLLQLKTLLDNADGQLARVTGRVTPFGRYLDTEADLVVNAALFGALGHLTAQPLLALVAFLGLALVLSVDVNLEPLYLAARDETPPSVPPAAPDSRGTRVLGAVYAIVFAPQDRLVTHVSERRLARVLDGLDDPSDRERTTRAYHDPQTLTVTANLELTTQLAVLGVCLAFGTPIAYLWFVVGCLALLPLLQLRREGRARRARRA